MKKITKVEPGQIWADNDPRAVNEELTVLSVDEIGMYAICKRGNRKVRIRCDRLLLEQNGRGYTYVGKKK